jgi:hypothetical protein
VSRISELRKELAAAASRQKAAVEDATGANTKRQKAERKELINNVSALIATGEQLRAAAITQQNGRVAGVPFDLDDDLNVAVSGWRSDVERLLGTHLDQAAVNRFNELAGSIGGLDPSPGQMEIGQLKANVDKLNWLLSSDARLQPL